MINGKFTRDTQAQYASHVVPAIGSSIQKPNRMALAAWAVQPVPYIARNNNGANAAVFCFLAITIAKKADTIVLPIW